MILIPTAPEVPLYVQRTTLDDQTYVLTFDYSQREDRWYLTISLPTGDVLARGWKLNPYMLLGPRIADRRMFSGALVVMTDSQDTTSPGWGELGENRRCQLYYMTAEELLATR